MTDENKNEQTEKQRNAESSDSELVTIPFAGQAQEKAILLLAAAEEENLDASVVQTTTGGFLVPKSLADKAGVEGDDLSDRAEQVRVSNEESDDSGTIKGEAGPTGTVDTNAGEDAESGTIQDQAEEDAAPRSNIDTVNEKTETRRRATKKASKKTSGSKNNEQE